MQYPEIKINYPTLPDMLRKYEKFARKNYFRGTNLKEFEAWKQESRETLKELLGLSKMEASEGWTKLSYSEELPNGIRREKLYLETEENVWVPMYILHPNRSASVTETPIFLCPPGHGGAGKYSIVGMREYEMVEKSIEKYNYDIGLQIAEMGYIAVCPDARGFGEMREELADTTDSVRGMNGDCYWLAHMGEPLGIPVLGMQVFDLMRILDYLEGRFAQKRINCVGFSGGGMQSLYLAALEDRIHSVFLSGYLYGFRDSLLKLNRNCSCNYVPHLWEHFDMGDIASLICPKRLLVQSGRYDRLNGERGIANVNEQIGIVRAAYEISESTEAFHHEIYNGGHQFYSENLKENLKFLLM